MSVRLGGRAFAHRHTLDHDAVAASGELVLLLPAHDDGFWLESEVSSRECLRRSSSRMVSSQYSRV